jgi:subtilisin family serine protease
MSASLKALTATVTVLLVSALAAPAEATIAAVGRTEPGVNSMTGALPKDAELYKLQWNLKAIHAHAAFSADEAFGSSEVRVAVVDTGIDYLHPDLGIRRNADGSPGDGGLVDLYLSTSLLTEAPVGSTCAGEPGVPYRSDRTKDRIDEIGRATSLGRLQVTDFHSHGTAVSGLIASKARFLAGVTQRTTLFGVKVHGIGRQNCLSVYLAGIYEAADRGADVIHLSIPLEFDEQEFPDAATAVNAALDYAHGMGAVMVAAAGNNAANLDGGTWFRFCKAPHVICVSATGPASVDWIEDPYWDEIAAYSNYGSAIDVAGPGGTTAVPVWLTCSTATEFSGAPQAPCRAGKPAWQSTGTSFGAAATSGLAAQVVSLIGDASPERVEQIIEQSADDLGAVGPDVYYGSGRINVKKAVALAQP